MSRSLILVSVGLFAILLPGCRGVDRKTLTARASDHWVRSYPLTPDGEFQIVGGAGSVDVRGGDGTTVDVTAERVAVAATESSASELVSRIKIREDVTSEKVVLQSVGLEGLVIGVEVMINYHVTVPRGAKVRVRTASGAITVADVKGSVVLSSASGEVTGTNMGGGVDARVVSGRLSMNLAAIGENPVDLRSVSGELSLTLPADARGILTITSVSGAVKLDDLKTEPIGEQTRRRQRLRLNDGGTPIEINTVSGGVRISARS
jgi:hypothetical protein